MRASASAPSAASAPAATGIVGDGDPMDICVLTEKSIGHGDLLVQAIPIGGLRMIDGNEADDKIIAVMRDDALYGQLTDIAQCPPSVIERLRHYFLTYKHAPGSPRAQGRDHARLRPRRSPRGDPAQPGRLRGGVHGRRDAEIGMRAERLISILMALQRGHPLTAGELAQRLEVSVRTIFRDIDALSTMGVPVYTEQGRGGGIRLVEGYSSDLTGLSSGEAEALALIASPAAIGVRDLADADAHGARQARGRGAVDASAARAARARPIAVRYQTLVPLARCFAVPR